MISIADGDITALRNFANENKLTLSEESEFSETVEKGKFISISKKPGEEINPGDEFKVVISLGASIELPNFIGMSANKAQTTCKNLGINCKLSYVYSSKTKGNVFNQSMGAGSKVIGDTTIVLTISNGPRPSGGSSSGNQSGGNSGSSNVPEPVCESYTLHLIAGQSVSQTKTMIQNANPKGKFNFISFNPGGYGTNGALRGDMFTTYQNTVHTSCETITIYIVDLNV